MTLQIATSDVANWRLVIPRDPFSPKKDTYQMQVRHGKGLASGTGCSAKRPALVLAYVCVSPIRSRPVRDEAAEIYRRCGIKNQLAAYREFSFSLPSHVRLSFETLTPVIADFTRFNNQRPRSLSNVKHKKTSNTYLIIQDAFLCCCHCCRSRLWRCCW